MFMKDKSIYYFWRNYRSYMEEKYNLFDVFHRDIMTLHAKNIVNDVYKHGIIPVDRMTISSVSGSLSEITSLDKIILVDGARVGTKADMTRHGLGFEDEDEDDDMADFNNRLPHSDAAYFLYNPFYANINFMTDDEIWATRDQKTLDALIATRIGQIDTPTPASIIKKLVNMPNAVDCAGDDDSMGKIDDDGGAEIVFVDIDAEMEFDVGQKVIRRKKQQSVVDFNYKIDRGTFPAHRMTMPLDESYVSNFYRLFRKMQKDQCVIHLTREGMTFSPLTCLHSDSKERDTIPHLENTAHDIELNDADKNTAAGDHMLIPVEFSTAAARDSCITEFYGTKDSIKLCTAIGRSFGITDKKNPPNASEQGGALSALMDIFFMMSGDIDPSDTSSDPMEEGLEQKKGGMFSGDRTYSVRSKAMGKVDKKDE